MSRVHRLATRVLATAVAFSAFGAMSVPAAHAFPVCAGVNFSVLGSDGGFVPCVPTGYEDGITTTPSAGDPNLVWVQVVVSAPFPV